jgi:hypothetical protein
MVSTLVVMALCILVNVAWLVYWWPGWQSAVPLLAIVAVLYFTVRVVRGT